jgi:hypothetical protein
MSVRFESRLAYVGALLVPLNQDAIRQMPMLYRADVPFALQQVPMLWGFIKSLPVNPFDFKYQSLDVKVAMLKKGWWPCIPGWHCDDFYRPTGDQPDVANLSKHNSQHFMVVFGDSSLTEFAAPGSVVELSPVASAGQTFYGYANANLESNGILRAAIRPNCIYGFDSMTFHRGMAATHDGWRAFVRLTLGSEREPKNEIRRQVQVYVPSDRLEAGW